MRFIGQNHIIRQLRFILPDLYENKRGVNFLLKGPSGFGKTTMALSMAHYLCGNDFEYYLGDSKEFNFRKWVVFIDEIHIMKTPEILYPVMDSRNHVFILASNQAGNLPEALVNRCYEYIFDDYTLEDLMLMAKESFPHDTTDENLIAIVEAGNRNPRVIKSLCDRLGIYFSREPNLNSRTGNFSEIIQDVFNIQDGLDTLCRRYLEVLDDIGGKASLSRLKTILHVDEATLVNQVEPILLKKGRIEITSKGRSLNG